MSGTQVNFTVFQRFADWKFNVRKKARNLRLYERGTGGGEAAAGTLTDLEQRLLGITGKVVVAGLVSLPELGVPQCKYKKYLFEKC